MGSVESCLLAFVFLLGALLTFSTSLAHSSLNPMTCRLKFLGPCLSITFLHSLVVAIPLLLITVAYRLWPMIAPSVLLVRTLYSERQEMRR